MISCRRESWLEKDDATGGGESLNGVGLLIKRIYTCWPMKRLKFGADVGMGPIQLGSKINMSVAEYA